MKDRDNREKLCPLGTEEGSDPVPEEESSQEWAVYYDGTIYGHCGRDRAGTEIPVEQEFQFAGRTWRIPSVYTCGKGLVVDFCMRVDAEEVQRFLKLWDSRLDGRDGEDINHWERLLVKSKNPLVVPFDPEMTVNGKVLRRRNASSVCYIPGDPSEPEIRFLAEHYHVDRSAAWCFTRACFPWKSRRRPEIRTMELTMVAEPVRIPGAIFEVRAPGEQIDLKIPGQPLVLTVVDLKPQVLDMEQLSPEEMEYPACCSVLSYTLSPQIDPDTFYLQDLAECDQPRQKRGTPSGDSTMEAEALSIIGGADGPTAIFAGAPQTTHIRSVCSALHFEPAERIQWYPVLRRTENPPVTVRLK